MSATPAAPRIASGPIAPDQLERLLPPSVYFQGQSAPLQLRNAAGVKLPNGILWAGLVDTSGYSTGVRERYQFYFVTEGPLRFGGKRVSAGAYGGGFLADGTFVLMDVGGHILETGATQTDSDLKRPRPLQIVQDGMAVRLLLGRQFVTLEPLAADKPAAH